MLRVEDRGLVQGRKWVQPPEDIVKFQSHLQLEAPKTQAEQTVLHCVKD